MIENSHKVHIGLVSLEKMDNFYHCEINNVQVLDTIDNNIGAKIFVYFIPEKYKKLEKYDE